MLFCRTFLLFNRDKALGEQHQRQLTKSDTLISKLSGKKKWKQANERSLKYQFLFLNQNRNKEEEKNVKQNKKQTRNQKAKNGKEKNNKTGCCAKGKKRKIKRKITVTKMQKRQWIIPYNELYRLEREKNSSKMGTRNCSSCGNFK